MKRFSFIAAIAALSLGSVAIATEAAAEAKIVNISKKYSKIQLDTVCAKEGGSSYGTADTAYGCTKGKNTVECNKDGSCKGYMWMQAASGAPTANHPTKNWPGSAELVLQMPPVPARPGMASGAGGVSIAP